MSISTAYTDTERDAIVDGVHATGAKWLPGRPLVGRGEANEFADYNWTDFEQIVARAHSKGMNVLPVIGRRPCQASNITLNHVAIYDKALTDARIAAHQRAWSTL